MEENIRYTFGKDEKLTSKKLIEKVFSEGKSFRSKHLVIKYLIGDFDVPSNCQVLISIPKRNIRTAVKRNLMKRRIREAYRLHKHDMLKMLTTQNKNMLLCIIYFPKLILNYNEIENNMIQITNNLKFIVDKESSNKTLD